MGDNFADRLLEAIDKKGSPVCVGLDPVFERLPDEYRAGGGERDPLGAIEKFSREVLRIVAGIVPTVKPQIAYFEVYRGEGVKLYFDLVREARDLGLIVIGDVKRNDIGATAKAYATGHLSGPDSPDAVTVNPYLGTDGIEPFAEVAADEGKGVFVLVRTSNPSAARTQDFTDNEGRKFYERIAEQVAALGSSAQLVGQRGYSCIGAVVGATYPEEAQRLREIMPQQLFLIPGYGAQGATAADSAASFKSDATGGIVNASRSVIYAYDSDKYANLDWREAIAQATTAFAEDVARAVYSRNA